MSHQGRSARTRVQRLARRRADAENIDRSASRSIFKSRWLLGGFGIIGAVALVASGVVIFFSDGTQPGAETTAQPVPVRRAGGEIDIGAVEGKPAYDAPPAFALAADADYGARIELESGDTVELDLYEDVAPAHVNNFVFLARSGFYDGLTFHRIIPGFVAQSGDPTATGTGGAGYTLPDEPLTDDNEDLLSLAASGLIAMARGGEGASSSQFFITLAPQPQLDEDGFTAFGEVVNGLEILHAFDSRDPGAIPPPLAGPRIASITILENGETTARQDSAPADIESDTDSAAAADQSDDQVEPPPEPQSWDSPPDFILTDGVDYRATIRLADGGEIVIDLFEELAPTHTNNFVFLSREGFYDGITFHRIVEDFVAQGGDPTGTGTGGAGYVLPDEVVHDENREQLTLDAPGVISMARSGLGASSSQFFITFEPVGFLDSQRFTAFGVVVEGLDIVRGFDLRDPSDPSEPPGPRIETIEITETAAAD